MLNMFSALSLEGSEHWISCLSPAVLTDVIDQSPLYDYMNTTTARDKEKMPPVPS